MWGTNSRFVLLIMGLCLIVYAYLFWGNSFWSYLCVAALLFSRMTLVRGCEILVTELLFRCVCKSILREYRIILFLKAGFTAFQTNVGWWRWVLMTAGCFGALVRAFAEGIPPHTHSIVLQSGVAGSAGTSGEERNLFFVVVACIATFWRSCLLLAKTCR